MGLRYAQNWHAPSNNGKTREDEDRGQDLLTRQASCPHNWLAGQHGSAQPWSMAAPRRSAARLCVLQTLGVHRPHRVQGKSDAVQPPMPSVPQISVDSAWAEGVPLFWSDQIIIPAGNKNAVSGSTHSAAQRSPAQHGTREPHCAASDQQSCRRKQTSPTDAKRMKQPAAHRRRQRRGYRR